MKINNNNKRIKLNNEVRIEINQKNKIISLKNELAKLKEQMNGMKHKFPITSHSENNPFLIVMSYLMSM